MRLQPHWPPPAHLQRHFGLPQVKPPPSACFDCLPEFPFFFFFFGLEFQFYELSRGLGLWILPVRVHEEGQFSVLISSVLTFIHQTYTQSLFCLKHCARQYNYVQLTQPVIFHAFWSFHVRKTEVATYPMGLTLRGQGRFPEEAMVQLRVEAWIGVNQEKKGKGSKQREQTVEGADRMSWEDSGWEKDVRRPVWGEETVRRSWVEGEAGEEGRSQIVWSLDTMTMVYQSGFSREMEPIRDTYIIYVYKQNQIMYPSY